MTSWKHGWKSASGSAAIVASADKTGAVRVHLADGRKLAMAPINGSQCGLPMVRIRGREAGELSTPCEKGAQR